MLRQRAQQGLCRLKLAPSCNGRTHRPGHRPLHLDTGRGGCARHGQPLPRAAFLHVFVHLGGCLPEAAGLLVVFRRHQMHTHGCKLILRKPSNLAWRCGDHPTDNSIRHSKLSASPKLGRYRLSSGSFSPNSPRRLRCEHRSGLIGRHLWPLQRPGSESRQTNTLHAETQPLEVSRQQLPLR